MATYCTADIHGQLDVFEKLLKDINLKKTDTLFVLGDVIDRGPCGIDILKIIMGTDNIRMIMGNHEQMCLDYLGPHGSYMAKGLWFNNGGQETYWDLIKMRNAAERDEILGFMESLPDYFEIEVADRKYYLVHGFPGETHHDRIWGRPKWKSKSPFKDTAVIIGHTPIACIPGVEVAPGDPLRIWHGDGIIDIDCGCPFIGGRLACLCLDDMSERYYF